MAALIDAKLSLAVFVLFLANPVLVLYVATGSKLVQRFAMLDRIPDVFLPVLDQLMGILVMGQLLMFVRLSVGTER